MNLEESIKEFKILKVLYPQYANKIIEMDDDYGIVVGYKSRNYKYPFVVEMDDGTVFHCTEKLVKRGSHSPSLSRALEKLTNFDY